MADLKISEMTPAAELTGAELIECVQGGVNVKQELTGLKTWVNDGVQPFSSTLDALSSFNTNGVMVQTAADTFTGRTITAGTGISVTNGDGVNGNPTISLPVSGVTAGIYGSGSAIPVVTVNSNGVVTGVSTASLAVSPVFSDSEFRVYDNDDVNKILAFEVSGIVVSPAATPTTKTITMPNANVNLGDLPSVATTNSNTLSGTRNRILGGSSTTVDGTDNVAIGCSNANISGTTLGIGGVVYNAVYNVGGILSLSYPKGSIVHGTSLHPLIVILDGQSSYGGALATTLGMCTVNLSANGSTNNITTDTAAPNNNNCPRLVAGYYISNTPYSALGSAVHDVEFIVTFGINDPLEPSRTFYAKRRVYAAYHTISGTPTWATSTETVGTDTNLGTVVGTVTVGFTLDTANNRLVPTITATGGQSYQVSVRVNSHYNRK